MNGLGPGHDSGDRRRDFGGAGFQREVRFGQLGRRKVGRDGEWQGSAWSSHARNYGDRSWQVKRIINLYLSITYKKYLSALMADVSAGARCVIHVTPVSAV